MNSYNLDLIVFQNLYKSLSKMSKNLKHHISNIETLNLHILNIDLKYVMILSEVENKVIKW